MSDKAHHRKKITLESRSLCFWRDVLAEFVGTFLLVAIQAMLPLSWGVSLGNVNQVSLGMGFVVCGLAWTLGDFGGGHFNPAVSIAMAASMKITVFRALVYTVVQCIGSTCGAASIIYSSSHQVITPESKREGLATTVLHPEVTVIQGYAIEGLITFILVFVIYGSTNSERKSSLFMPPIPIGFAVTLGIMAAFASTGASMNPAPSLGPAIVMGIWTNHWVYWVGPFSGGIMATFVYMILDWVKENQPQHELGEDVWIEAKTSVV